MHGLSIRAIIRDLGTSRHKSPNGVRESLAYETIGEILTSTSAVEHKSSLGGMPVLGNVASQNIGVEFLPHDYPILSVNMTMRFWPQQSRLVCEELCCFSLPLGLRQIIARSWEWFLWFKSNAANSTLLKAPLASDIGLQSQPLGHLRCFFFKILWCETTKQLELLYLYEWALYQHPVS